MIMLQLFILGGVLLSNKTGFQEPTLIELSKEMKPILKVQPHSNLTKQLKMMDLTKKDLAIAQVLRPYIKQEIDAVVNDFYENLKHNPMLIDLIDKHGSFARHQDALRMHIVNMFKGVIDESFIKRRETIANVHVKVGLPQEWYVLSFEQIFRSIVRILKNTFHHQEDLFIATAVVDKLITLETQVVLDAFNQELNRLQKEGKKVQQELIYMAYHDDVTGFPNRNKIIRDLTKRISMASNLSQKIAVAHLSIDYTRFLSASFHHDMEQLQIAISERLKRSIHSYACELGKLEGDEFVIVMPYQNEKKLNDMMEDIIRTMENPLEFAKKEIYLTLNIGVAIYPTSGTSTDTLLRNANFAMLEQKKYKKSGYCIFTCELKKQINERIVLEDRLREAIRLNDLELHYQPQINAFTNELIGLEALLRWNHPSKGQIPPGKFIPIAEETGIIHDISNWVIHQACKDLKDWHDKGNTKIPVWVNLSPFQFYDLYLVERIKEVLEDVKLDSKYLGLEITESAMMDTKISEAVLYELKELGVQLSLDDFGTGYSSLSYLHRLPIHGLKIDRSFIMNMTESEDSKAIISSIILLAKQLSLKTIAEGVETKEQLQFLLNRKCYNIQGFYFSRPLPIEQIEREFA